MNSFKPRLGINCCNIFHIFIFGFGSVTLLCLWYLNLSNPVPCFVCGTWIYPILYLALSVVPESIQSCTLLCLWYLNLSNPVPCFVCGTWIYPILYLALSVVPESIQSCTLLCLWYLNLSNPVPCFVCGTWIYPILYLALSVVPESIQSCTLLCLWYLNLSNPVDYATFNTNRSIYRKNKIEMEFSKCILYYPFYYQGCSVVNAHLTLRTFIIYQNPSFGFIFDLSPKLCKSLSQIISVSLSLHILLTAVTPWIYGIYLTLPYLTLPYLTLPYLTPATCMLCLVLIQICCHSY